MLYPVILCGGSGTRLWPLSRKLHPKQFLPLQGGRTLLQETAERIHSLLPTEPVLAVTNEDHRFTVAEQLKAIGKSPERILLEPEGRNTAPAVALAALYTLRNHENPLLWVLPADHFIQDAEQLRESLSLARTQAEQGRLVTFGITPTSPETEYGYIQQDQALTDNVFTVKRFVEKPDAQTAQNFLSVKDYLWNSGMFLFSAKRYLQELERFAPDILASSKAALDGAQHDLEFLRLGREAFLGCRADSVDYAVMEKTKDAAVIPLMTGWSDLGSFRALHDLGDKDDMGNCTVGDVLLEKTSNTYVHGTGRLVAVLGIENATIVETSDSVLVASQDHVQDVKQIVGRLAQAGRQEALTHRKVYRPWGSYESMVVAPRFQVKRLSVNPGATLSLQKHHHRAEHWVVVSGTARVTKDDSVFILSEDESTYIPLGAVHRLENPGKIPLEIIEVQTGSYLGEDDIVRLGDVYGRENS